MVVQAGTGEVIDSRGSDMVVSQRNCHRRLLADMYKTQGDLVNFNIRTRAFPEFAYDQRKARRQ